MFKRIIACLHDPPRLPSQRTLDTMLANVTRIKVFDSGMVGDKPLGKNILLEVKDPRIITSLAHNCLNVFENPESFGHCMCDGDLTMVFYANQKRLAAISFHHGRSIRWNAWKYDAVLQNGRCYLDWLAKQGITAPLRVYEDDQFRAEVYQRDEARWKQAMPECLASFWDEKQALFGVVDVEPMLQVLETTYPDLETRVLILFRWYGCGGGLWSGYAAYEGVAEKLLLEFPTALHVAALTHHPLSPECIEGAARYFAGYHFNKDKPDDARLIPLGLKQTLLEHSLTSSDEDKINRAKRAFASQ